MVYKTFTGETLNEAINRARLEYGNWVQLVDQKRKVERKGPFGLLGKREYFEITVNVNESNRASRAVPDFELDQTRRKAFEQINSLMRTRELLSQGKAPAPAPATARPEQKETPPVERDVLEEIKELKGALEKIVESSATRSREPREEGFSHGAFDMIRRFLERNDFEKYFIERILEGLSNSLTVKQMSDNNLVRARLEELLCQEIPLETPVLDVSNGPRIVVLVGPTGVGKTTTIAKIGANLSLKEDRRVVFMSMDNYRIAGREQIAKYAEIMDLPLRIIDQKEQLEMCLKQDKGDFYLLDTAGRNQKKELELNEIRNFLRVIKVPVDIYLVVSATTKYNDLLEIMEKFEIIGYDKVIVTKVDETNTFGSVISALAEKKKKLSYIGMGQIVPDDIKIAERQDLVTRVIMKFPAMSEEALLAG